MMCQKRSEGEGGKGERENKSLHAVLCPFLPFPPFPLFPYFHLIAQPMGLVMGDCTGRPANKLLTASSTYRRCTLALILRTIVNGTDIFENKLPICLLQHIYLRCSRSAKSASR